jgi:signal transduction histidine kinase
MTIRRKMTLVFSTFLVALVLVGVLLNVGFLLRFYIRQNRAAFLTTASAIAKQYASDKSGVETLIDGIDRLDNISCTISDAQGRILFTSFPVKTDAGSRKLAADITKVIRENQSKLATTFVYTVLERQDGLAPKLVFVRRLDDGGYLVLQKAMKGIRESVAIANRFYVFSGLALLLVGGVFVYFFAKRMTRPIVEMSEVAEGISNLDFSRRVGTEQQDEIGTLGRSIDRISERLSASLEELKLDVERRKQLVRNISHELKSPIGVIKGYAEGLRFGVAEDPEKSDRYCAVIAEECDRMDGMVRELLTLSMLESGGMEAHRMRFDLGDVVRRVAERFEPVLSAKGIAFSLDVPGPAPVEADEELVERAVVNYLTNAMNHADDDRRVVAAVGRAPGGGTRLSVFNTGSGIPPKEMARIWDVFHKVDQARSREYGGHGLGLSIVKLVAGLHGGAVGVENVDGGVRFFLDLP